MAQRPTGGRTRALLFLAISAVAAIFAVGLIYKLIRSYQEQLADAQAPELTIDVVVATHPLYQGQTLTDQDVTLRQYPPSFVPETTFHSLDEVIGRVPAERILEGEYLRKERLAPPEAGVGLNAIIPKGMRALSLNISDGSSVSGFLNPGNYVDVLATLTPQKDGATPTTVTMLQARKVLAVNSRMGSAEDAPEADNQNNRPSITLAVTPEEAEHLTHATIIGAVTLTLRNDVDVTQVKTEGAHADKLIGRVDQPAVQIKPMPQRKPTPQERLLQIIRGQSIENQHYDSQGQTHP